MVNLAISEMTNLSDLLIFVRVVETGSFTAAADSLNLSRSAIGKCIQRLEYKFHTRLIYRTTRTLSLSEEGHLFYEYAQRILQEVEETETLIMTRTQKLKGRLRLTVPVAFGRIYMMPIILDFLNVYSEIEIEVIFSDEFQDLIHDGIDVAIRFGQHVSSNLVQQKLASHWLITCASPSYLREKGKPYKIEDLQQHQNLIYLHQGHQTPWRFYIEGNNIDYVAQGRIRLYDVESLRDAALNNFGIIQVGAYLVTNDIYQGTLVPVLEDIAPLQHSIYAVYPSKRHISPKVKALIEFIRCYWQIQPPSWENPES